MLGNDIRKHFSAPDRTLVGLLATPQVPQQMGGEGRWLRMDAFTQSFPVPNPRFPFGGVGDAKFVRLGRRRRAS